MPHGSGVRPSGGSARRPGSTTPARGTRPHRRLPLLYASSRAAVGCTARRWYRRLDAHPAPLHDRCHRPLALRPRRGGSRPDAHHARPAASSRRSPRAIRRPTSRLGGSLEPFAELTVGARPRPDVRRRDPGQRRARLAEPARLARDRRRPPGTSPSWPTARSRSATPPSRCTRCCGAPTSCSTPGWRPGASRAGTRCTSSTSSGSAPRSTAASSATGSSSPTSASAGSRRSAASSASAARARRTTAPGCRSRRSSCSRPTSASTSRRSPALRLAPAVEREVEAALREFVARRPRARRSLARVPRRGPPRPGAGLMATVELRDIVTEDDFEAVARPRVAARARTGSSGSMISHFEDAIADAHALPPLLVGPRRRGRHARRLRDDQRRRSRKRRWRRDDDIGRAVLPVAAAHRPSVPAPGLRYGRPSTPSSPTSGPGRTAGILLTSCKAGRGLAPAVLPERYGFVDDRDRSSWDEDLLQPRPAARRPDEPPRSTPRRRPARGPSSASTPS